MDFASARATTIRKRWGKFELFKGRDFDATKVKRETLDEFRAELRKQDHEINQVARHIEMVKRVFRWGVENDVIPPTKVTSYRFKRSRDEKPLEIPEYSPAEATAILSQFDPRDSRRWRMYVASYVLAFAGPRQNAALNLRWSDITFTSEERRKARRTTIEWKATIRWRPENDKLGKDRTQPVPAAVAEALWVAYGWAIAFGYAGELVFFRPGAGTRDRGIRWKNKVGYVSERSRARAAAKPDKPWTYASYHAGLMAAEKVAKVPHMPYRAAHGFRRYVVNEILAKTGNIALAGQYIGDDDIRTLQASYVRPRAEDLRAVSDHMEGAAVSQASPRANRNAVATKERTDAKK
jgi:integrase